MANDLLVCKVDEQNYYGSKMKYDAARLEKGTPITYRIPQFNGPDKIGASTVKCTWFYDGPVIKCEDGTDVDVSCGHTFAVVEPPPAEEKETT